MTNFIKLNNLPNYDLYSELLKLQQHVHLKWNGGQICINTCVGKEDDYSYGSGSLFYDWDASYKEMDVNGLEKLIVPERKIPLYDKDFTVICNIFKDTLFEVVYNELNRYYVLGRVRLMKSQPKTTLTWHVDDNDRVHYPLKTQEGCFMVIEDKIEHLAQDTWWYTKTQVPHTAFNASKEERIHLVAVILGNR